MTKRVGYAIVRLLDRHRNSCWTKLVCKVEYGGRSWRDCRIDDMCISDATETGVCYCGQVIRTDRLREDLVKRDVPDPSWPKRVVP